MRPTICTRCTGCDVSLITDQATPLCGLCQRLAPAEPPRLRNPNASVTPSLGSLWVGLVFLAGVAVGAKMTGGW